MSNDRGVLYVVATPIGNLDDLSDRARRILDGVDMIGAEDTRHSGRLLRRLGISTPLRSFHDFNEEKEALRLVSDLKKGLNVAIVSDAGTPLICDPGFRLVRLAHQNGIRVVPIPGCSALVAALSVAGVPTDRFIFEGYAPERTAARRRRFRELAGEARTVVFYEAPHRITGFLQDAAAIFGNERIAAVARELTKQFETVRRATLAELLGAVRADPDQQRGEMVVLIEAGGPDPDAVEAEGRRVMEILMQRLAPGDAAGMAAEITGAKRNALYRYAIRRNGGEPE